MLSIANDSLPNYWNDRPVAMTGATGFIGTHLAKLLRSFGANVRALVRPSSDCSVLKSIGVDCRPVSLDESESIARSFDGCEYVFHLAGAVDFKADWRRFHQVNVVGAANVLRAAQHAGVRRTVVTSSIVAVGASASPALLDESATWNLASLRIPYVTTKRQAEDLALGERFGAMDVVVVNPSCVLGPGDAGSEFGVICQRFWRGRIPFYFGGGSNFVDVRDVALGHLAAAERGREGHRYLLTGTNLTWNDFFLELSRTANRSIPRVRLPAFLGEWFATCEDRVRGERSSRPNLSPAQARLMPLCFFFQHDKATSELGYRPRGLRETLAAAYCRAA